MDEQINDNNDFEEKERRLHYWNQKLIGIKGQTMTLHFTGGQTINNALIESVDLVKGLVYYRPNNGKGALSFVKWDNCLFHGADYDEKMQKMDLARLAEET